MKPVIIYWYLAQVSFFKTPEIRKKRQDIFVTSVCRCSERSKNCVKILFRKPEVKLIVGRCMGLWEDKAKIHVNDTG